MKILIVTGKLADAAVRNAASGVASKYKIDVDVLTLNIRIAAFITPRHLEKQKLKGYDLILIPGLITADFSAIENRIRTPIRLGPKHACDLEFVLRYADSTGFSSKTPACELLLSKMKKDAESDVLALEKKVKCTFMLKSLKVGGNSAMKVMAEIFDASGLGKDELETKIRAFIKRGADIIDLGFGWNASGREIKKTVEAASSMGVPIAVDSADAKQILSGIESGADMVASMNKKMLKKIGKNIADVGAAAVIIPDENQVSLFDNISLAKSIGIEKIVADPILRPLGFGATRSLVDCYTFRVLDSDTPLFFGAGNITESIDADSIGVNAVLAGIAMELNASIIFTPEKSDKAAGSVSELKRASKMMLLAKQRGAEPKDLGIDLLFIKEKRKREAHVSETGGNIVKAEGKTEWTLDRKGYIRIFLKDGTVIAKHRSATVTGKNAKEILDTLFRLNLVSSLEHAGYLGRELMKAELALRFGRSYVQDDEF